MKENRKDRGDKSTRSRSDESDLLSYLEIAMRATSQSYENHKKNIKYFIDIDSLFVDLIPYATKIEPPTAAVLLVNSHAVYRSAIQLSLAGQIIPVFMALRGAIESALYANAMVMKPELQDIWLNRGKDEESRKICRQEFQFGKVLKYLEDAQDKEFSQSVNDAYQNTIDFGAHPNSRTLLNSIHIEDMDDGKQLLQFAYIHSSDSFELCQSLIACAEVGVTIFFILLIAAGEQEGLKELNHKALDIHNTIPDLIKVLGLEKLN